MKRRLFLLSGTASAAAALTGCGGGGGADVSAAAFPVPEILRQRTSATSPKTTTTTTTTTAAAPSTTTSTAATVAYPFGARLSAYAAGIRPTQATTTMDAALAKQYDAWKAARIVPATSVVTGGYANQFSNATYLTVSEGMGYAMLLAVLFAGHDANARQLFDGLLAVVRKRYAYSVAQYDPNGKYLMDWELYADGSSAGGGWSACDGDLDIAMSLLMADRQWGSSGTWNYRQEALNTIAALKSWNFDQATGSVGGRGVSHPGSARISDYMIGHFRAFRAATGDTFWDMAIAKNLATLDYLQTTYSPGAGLLPDWAVNVTTTTPAPSPGFIGDGTAQEGDYWWNSCRDPWRLAADYVLSADTGVKTVCGRMVQFFQGKVTAAGGDVTVIGTGYALDGTQLAGGNDAAYMAPLMLGGCIDASHQGLVDALWTWNAGHLTTGYYDSEIQLLSMVTASGNWWTPNASLVSSASTSTATSTPASAPAPANLLANGDFSSGTTGWNNWGNFTVVNGAANVGTAAGGFASQDITAKLTPGQKYTVTATANITVAAEGVFVGVNLFDSTGATLLSQSQLVSSLTPTSAAVQFTAPQGAASGYVYVWKNANSAVGVVDNLSLAAG
jgi:hypothetical protein